MLIVVPSHLLPTYNLIPSYVRLGSTFRAGPGRLSQVVLESKGRPGVVVTLGIAHSIIDAISRRPEVEL